MAITVRPASIESQGVTGKGAAGPVVDQANAKYEEGMKTIKRSTTSAISASIAFIADDGKIVNIEEMQAETTNNHCPKAAVRYALEMNKQWFSERVIVPGAVIQGLPKK
jgi:uncharacterized membrane protein (UPF0127 family)